MDRWTDERAAEERTSAITPAITPHPEQVWASRAVIERATGVLMERHRLDADRAKELLLEASRRTSRTMRQLAEDVLASGSVGEPPVIRQILEAASTSPALLRAAAFIESAAGRPIRLSEVAEAAGIGERALQYGFVRYYGTTPMGYLRAVRLERAHRELLAAEPGDGVTVAEVAARWGFSSSGRFAAQYRAVYGRTPHRTLNEHRPRRPDGGRADGSTENE